MKKTKLAAIILTAAIMAAAFAVPASAYDIIDINVPIGEARINGIIDPGEWDAATAIYIGIDTMRERGLPSQNRDDIPAVCSVSLKVKVKDGYLYFLEERKNPNLKFHHDNPMHSYETNGGILWFFVDGADPHDLFYMAGTKSNPTKPSFCYRSENNNDNRVILGDSDFEGVTVLTPGVGSVCEAKIKLSSLGLTVADFEGGNLTMFHCNTQVWLDSYNDQACKYLVDEGNTATLGFWEWAQPEDERQPGFVQTDVPAWADSGNYRTVKDTFDLAALLAKEAAEAAAAAEAEAAANAEKPAPAPDTPAPAAPAPTPAAPATGDPTMLSLLLLAISGTAAVVRRKKR